MKRLSADFWSGLALGGLGAYIIVTASRWEYLGQDGPGPGFFPLWYGIAMSVLSLCLVVSSLKDKRSVDWSDAPRVLATWLAFAVLCAALKWIGFIAGFALLSLFIILVMYRRPLKVAVMASVALAAGFYLVFPLALGVKLP